MNKQHTQTYGNNKNSAKRKDHSTKSLYLKKKKSERSHISKLTAHLTAQKKKKSKLNQEKQMVDINQTGG